uniref:Uncharacterized protein n=1 Tax=Rhizochromulina marina TaxID=1034831 RepID=A0A6U1BP74_9STRA
MCLGEWWGRCGARPRTCGRCSGWPAMQWVLTAVAVAVAACAMMAASGFRGRPNTVGIDLGTTYSVIALRTLNATRVLKDEHQRSLIPSMVYFGPGGVVKVGYDAMAFLHSDPENVIFNAKRFIGRSFDDEAVQEQRAVHPFRVVNRSVPEVRSQAWFALSAQGHEDWVSPESVGKHVLQRLKDIAVFNLGHKQITRAVVSVPAKFNTRQRQATVDAYKAAGLKVMRVIDEPTAAAVAYGLDKKSDVQWIIVYDFGGGTLDVSLLMVNEESIQMIATHGDDQLGGADFDQCLMEHLRSTSWLPHDADPCSPRDDVPACGDTELRPMAESIKCQLSDAQVATASCGYRNRSDEDCRELSIEVTRSAFEEACDPLFQRVLRPVDLLLGESGMPAEEIDEVVLVGGTSRIPRIRELLKEKIGVDHLNMEIDPDITVAVGAASIVD